MIHPWTAALIGLIGALFGALVTGGLLHLKIVDRVRGVEDRVDKLEEVLDAEKDRTSERIFQVADMMKAVLGTANEILKQNSVLVTTAEVLIKELREQK